MGILFWLTIFNICSLLTSFGIPTNPSSSASGIVFIALLFFVWIEIASVPLFFKELTMSSLKSIQIN